MAASKGMCSPRKASPWPQLLPVPLLLLLAVVQCETMPVNPPRYDPLALRQMYYEMNRKREVTPHRCAKLRKGLPLSGAREQDAKILDYIQIAPRSGSDKHKLLCVSYTYDGDHEKKGISMASSWMHRCDGALVLSNATDIRVPAVAIPHTGPEEYRNIWQKVRNIWKYIHDEYMDDYDYFVIGGTDYYVIVENLRAYLESEALVKANEEVPLYLGRRFAEAGKMDKQFNSGGPSYILNKKALKLFVDNIEKEECVPRLHGPWEDVMIAKCLRIMSEGTVLPYDTRDSEQRELFHPFTPGVMFNRRIEDVEKLKKAGKKPQWFSTYSAWGLKTGMDSHSPQSIAWHYITPPLLKFMEDLLYGCRALDKPPQVQEVVTKTASSSSNSGAKDGNRGLERKDTDLIEMAELRRSITKRHQEINEATARFDLLKKSL